MKLSSGAALLEPAQWTNCRETAIVAKKIYQNNATLRCFPVENLQNDVLQTA